MKPAIQPTPTAAHHDRILKTYDVAILGGGPAGFALAAALSQRQLTVALISDDLEKDWKQTYCGWVNELEATGFGNFVLRSWPKVVFELPHGNHSQTVHRAYCQIDNTRLKQHFKTLSNTVDYVHKRAKQVLNSRVILEDDQEIQARLVVDCTGGNSTFTPKQQSLFQTGYQIFYGETIELAHPHGLPLDTFTLMDWREVSSFNSGNSGDSNSVLAPPSFVYIMPIDANTLFAEETILSTPWESKKTFPFDTLKNRLYNRFQQRGWNQRTVLNIEQAAFPMGGPLPILTSTLAFGAAAGMNHPASGFLIVSMLRRLQTAVEGVLKVLEHPEQTHLYWNTLWSSNEQTKYYAASLAQQTIHSASLPWISDFFHTFSRLNPTDQSILMSNTGSSKDLLKALLRFSLRSSRSVIWELMKSVFKLQINTQSRRISDFF